MAASLDLCACGCGEHVNARLSLARELRAEGLAYSKIGPALNCSGAYVKALLKNPPRYIKGHSARVGARLGMATCANPRCRQTFRKMGDNHLYCTSSSARPRDPIRAECGRLSLAAKWERWNEWDAAVEGRRARREALVSQRRLLRGLLRGSITFGSRAFRERKLAEVEDEIESLRDDLRVLYDEQKRDEKWGHRAGSKWIFSLDAPWRGDDDQLYDYREGDDAIAAAFRSYSQGHAAGNGWTDVVHAIVDRRREVDQWAELVA